MGIFSALSRRQSAAVLQVEEGGDLSELNQTMMLAQAREEKSLAYQDYQAFQNLDENGGFFGSEFQIRATAARLKGLYMQEPWIYTAATLLAKTLSSIPLRIIDLQGGPEFIPNHALEKIWEKGSAIQSGRALHWTAYLDLVLGGNFFLVLDQFFTGMAIAPVELVSINLSENSDIGLESITVSNPMRSGQRFLVSRERVIQVKLPNPGNPFFGMSPFMPAARPVLLDRYMNEFNMALYLRGGTYSGIIECTQDISKERLARLMRSFEANYTGKKNWWRQMFLPKGASWKPSSLNMADMQHLEGLKENRKTILACLGIPPSMVGLTDDVNYATSEAQMKIFYETTILPYLSFIEAGLNNSYLVQTVHKNRFRFKADLSGISCLNDNSDLMAKAKLANELGRYWTINEVRGKLFALPSRADGDSYALKATPAFGDRIDQEPVKALPAASIETELPALSAPDEATEKATLINTAKAQAEMNNKTVERTSGAAFKRAYDVYLKSLFEGVKSAVASGQDVKKHLDAFQKERSEVYLENVMGTLKKAMERGYTANFAGTKLFSGYQKARRGYEFSEHDVQAIDILRNRKKFKREGDLEEKVLDRFYGFDETRTEQIMQLIEDGYQDGQSLPQIAKDIEKLYGENYSDQAFTITRTEVLSAVSAGIKNYQEDLKTIFTEVQKQWISVGDTHVRDSHQAYEDEGIVDADHKWGDYLSVPREYGGPPEEVINCRCSVVNIIPPGSESRASAIVEEE